jgi:formylglycine-generating enzyme required for sulfatase activity
MEELRDRFGRGEITASDYVRHVDKPTPESWRRIKELPGRVAKLGISDYAVPPDASPGLRHILAKPRAFARETNPAISPAGVQRAWFRTDLLSVIRPSLAILLTFLNTGLLLLANADADEPATAKAKQSESDGDEDDARKAAPRPPKEQAATMDEILTRLKNIDTRITAIDQHAKMHSSKDQFCQAMEAGILEFSVADTAFRFIFIPAGTFRFGYPADEQNRVVRATGNPNSFLNATPECVVNVTRGFFMLDREVTVAQWNSCTQYEVPKPAPAKNGQEQTPLDAPKRNISWLEAQSFCSALEKAVPWLSADACQVRLPTEIEWEYASRGSQLLHFPWVPRAGAERLFQGSAKGFAAPIAVDPLKNNDLSWRGQFDFAGNLAEWCLDSYDQSLHEALVKRQADSVVAYEPADDPLVRAALAGKNSESNPSRTLRGGSILDAPEACELPMRRFLLQNTAADHIGFRPVIVLEKAAAPAPKEKQ